jgi:hypothetical protein
MPRAQNAHAYVNAGFLFKMKVSDGGKVLGKPTIVYGGINPQFVSMVMMMMMIMMVVVVVVPFETLHIIHKLLQSET